MSVTSYEFPKSFEGRMNSVLCTINTEWKSIMWSLMDERWMTIGDIRTEYEKSTGRLLNNSNFKNYNNLTLIPIGLVAKKSVRKQGYSLVNVYSLKEEGTLLQPVANFAIKTVVDNGMSMYEVFGQVSSNNRERRSPLTTYQILKKLDENKNLRRADFINKYGIDPTLPIERLSKIGFVEYDSVNTENTKGNFSYILVKGKSVNDVKNFRGHSLKNLSLVTKLAIEKGEIDKDILQDLGFTYGTAINLIYSLSKQGILKPRKYQAGKKQSDANITDRGRKFLEEFIIPIEDSLRQDRIKIHDSILAASEKLDFDYRQRAHDFYEPFSGRKRENIEDRIEEARKLLGHGPMRVGEFFKRLGVKNLEILERMEDRGDIGRARRGKASFVMLSNKNKSEF